MQNCKILIFFHQISYSLLIVSSRIMMETNPWQVDSIEAFAFLNCPECTFLTKEEKYFAYHAALNHPLSNSFFNASTNANKLRNTDSIPIKKGIDITFSVIKSEYVDSGRCAFHDI